MKTNIRTLIPLAMSLIAFNAAAQTTKGPQPTMCNRSCWSARAPQCSISQQSSITHAVIHHTASSPDWDSTSVSASAARVRAHQNYHMDYQGWCDIAYHFLVDKFGHIFEGRSGSISSLPRGGGDVFNDGALHFTFLGHCDYDAPPSGMRHRVYDVIAWKMPTGWTPYGSATYDTAGTKPRLHGHRNTTATSCPGDLVYQYIGSDTSDGEARTNVGNRRTPGKIIVADNGTSAFSASGNWIESDTLPGAFNVTYTTRAVQATTDEAVWTKNLPASGSYTVQAWWTAHANRSTVAPYVIARDGGSTTVTKNQQINGGTWVTLGTFNISSGNRTVKLKCNAANGSSVCADAVRWVKN